MFRSIAVLLLPVLCASAQNVKITWIGQSCFVIQTEGGPAVVTDPPVASVGYTLPAQPADVVTVSHNHTDHNNVAGVRGTPAVVDGRTITGRQETTAAGMTFVLIPSFHDNTNGAQRGANAIIRWTQGGLKFAHLGDYGQDQLTDAQLADLRDIDVMIIPAGGFFTIDAQKAAAFIKQLQPRVAVLMHVRTAFGGPAQLAVFPSFIGPLEPIVYKPATVALNRASLPASTETWLMEVAADAAAVNAAGFSAGAPVAPGSIAALFGNFTGSLTAAAGAYPLPNKLGETEVLVAGNAVPLFFVSPSQINFQVPRAQPSGQPLVEVRAGGQRIARASLTVLPSSPGLFGVLNQDGRLNSPSAPARPGQVLQIYGSGQGATSPAVDDGAAAPGSPLAVTPEMPSVYLEGRLISVAFSGLAPGFAGVWQINAVIPQDTRTGPTLSLAIIHGLTSNKLPVAVE